MPSSKRFLPALRPAALGGFCLATFGFLAWLTYACIFGSVERELPPRLIRGGGPQHHAEIPVPPHIGAVRLVVLESGLPLEERSKIAPAKGDEGGPFASGAVVIRFSTSDGTQPRRNGRKYSFRYPRRSLTASLTLLVTCWLLFPWAVFHWLKGMRHPRVNGPSLDTTAWSLLTLGALYSLFAVQAWLPPSNTPWFLALAACGLPTLLARLGRGRLVLPEWTLWLAGLLLWTGYTAILGSPYASFHRYSLFVAAFALGWVLYVGLRGCLQPGGVPGTYRNRLLLGLFFLAIGLSLARDGGFDLVGGLTTLGLTTPWSGGLVNLWTTKLMGHWLLVVGWSTLVSLWRQPLQRWAIVTVATLGPLALVLNGSRSALAALAVSAVTAIMAFFWPRLVRRLVLLGIVSGVLLAPLVAGALWQGSSRLQDTAAKSMVSALDLNVRGSIWELSRQLIAQHPIFGWGFGATANLPDEGLSRAEALGLDPETAGPAMQAPMLLGGHPHNAALLIWLDLGLVGALLVAGLILTAGRSLAAVESQRGTHGALVGLLAASVTILVFNYPLWAPEVLSLLWMSVVLATVTLPPPAVSRRSLLRDGAAVLVILALGSSLLAQDRLSRWWTVRKLRQNPVELDVADARLLAGGETWTLGFDHPLESHAEWLESGWIQGWAFDPAGGGAPDAVLVFVGSKLVGVARPELVSTELFRRLRTHDVAALTAGFQIPAPPEELDLDAPVMVVALEAEKAYAAELPALAVSPAER